jgi:light-regulated signal transduction histidine kinase (bacteriophytochrome)
LRTLELQTSNRELEAFCYSVSHDLRAPLRGINGFSQALQDDYADKLDATANNFLQRIGSGCQRMAQLIDDLLKLSRLSRAEMQRRPVNLSEMAQGVAVELRQTEPERAVQFNIAEGLTSVGDPALLRVALSNLMGNAWKFSSNGTESLIEFGSRQDGHAIYFVRDNGTGFDMAYADKLFQPFQRLHAAKEFPGTGVGLATVARVIHRHGGRVWAEAVPGQGATFYFTLEPEAEQHG